MPSPVAPQPQGQPSPPLLDVISIGRSSVDLYGQQIGGRLEDMASFSKAVGGCPANIAIGTARLGLRSGLITRVGDEHMGRFIREQMCREGVALDGIHTDPARLTALVLLGVSDDSTFPLIFMRENCADAALDESDIDPAFVASAAAIVVTGTHFATPHAAAAQRKAIRIARAHGRKIVFDIDYRPNLWGLAGHGAGEERYLRSETVTAHLQAIVPDCDLIVGTEEELHIAAGSEDTLDALAILRRLSPGALLVCKRGPMGCVVFPGAIPARLDDGVRGPGFPVEVYNVLGAGDAFMSGFLRGWLRGEALETTCAYANACGAFAVSRLLCSPESPTFAELQHFLAHGSPHRALRHDPVLNHLHHTTTRRAWSLPLHILSIDHGAHDLEPLALAAGADPARIPAFKRLAVAACERVARGREEGREGGRAGFGLFLDGALGRQALFDAQRKGLWLARQFPHGEAGAFADHPLEWPVGQVIKLIANARADARTTLAVRLPEIISVMAMARASRRETMIEALAAEGQSTAELLESLYQSGLMPDVWLVEPPGTLADAQAIDAVISRHDPACRGLIVIARNAASGPELARAAPMPRVIGFVGGRAIFGDALRGWLDGALDDDHAVDRMAERFGALSRAFDDGRS
jgi:5-dehydro-2-deoxygluconokinase